MENRKYWLHRISHEWDVSYPLLEKGYLSIGWSCLCHSNILDSMKETVDTELFEKIMMENGLQSYRSRWALWYFFSFNIDDYIVVPMFEGEFSIYRVLDRAKPISELSALKEFTASTGETISYAESGLLIRQNTGNTVDLGYVVHVEPVKDHLSRYEYADNKLTSRMKIRQTNADISDLADSILDALSSDSPINLYSTVIEELSLKLLDVIERQLTPSKFEMLIRWYFRKIGASRAYIPAKNEPNKWDGADADIIAEFDPLKVVFYVQAKLHTDQTSTWAIEQISMYKEQHEVSAGEFTIIPWVITSAKEFSPEAIALAQNNDVRLITGIQFARMLIDAGITDINSAFD